MTADTGNFKGRGVEIGAFLDEVCFVTETHKERGAKDTVLKSKHTPWFIK